MERTTPGPFLSNSVRSVFGGTEAFSTFSMRELFLAECGQRVHHRSTLPCPDQVWATHLRPTNRVVDAEAGDQLRALLLLEGLMTDTFRQITDDLRQRIHAGGLAPGAVVPSELTLGLTHPDMVIVTTTQSTRRDHHRFLHGELGLLGTRATPALLEPWVADPHLGDELLLANPRSGCRRRVA